jgi:hypothetical protein
MTLRSAGPGASCSEVACTCVLRGNPGAVFFPRGDRLFILSQAYFHSGIAANLEEYRQRIRNLTVINFQQSADASSALN